MRAPRGGWAAGPAAIALAAALVASPAHARPFTVDDLLQREGIGQAFVTPGDRWLVIERHARYAGAARFDFEKYTDVWRTHICRADLRRPGPCKDLLSADRHAGVMAGPASPDGARLMVYRFAPEGGVTLGVLELSSGAVRWFAVAPDVALFERTVQWISPQRFLAITDAPGRAPFNVRWGRPQAALPERWATTARGGLSVTAVGSGSHLDERPRDPPRRLVEIDVASGRIRRLATGNLVDLEAAPSGRWAALFEDAEDIPLTADRAVQGAYGVATHRRRLRILDLFTGRASGPFAWDLLGRLVRWSDEDRLLVFGRRDGAPWAQGRLLVVDARMAEIRPLDTRGVVPEVRGRPETVRADWLGNEVVVFGARPGERPGWARIGPNDAVALTASLPAAPRDDVALTPKGLLAIEGGAAWRITPEGTAVQVADGLTPLRVSSNGFRARMSYAPGRGRLDAVDSSRSDPALVRVNEPGQVMRLPMRQPGALLATETSQLAGLVRRPLQGAAEALDWVSPGRAPVRILTLNSRLAAVDLPTVHPIHHTGPAGEALTSWLLLPSRPPAAPPPLVVYPYLGAVYAEAPSLADPRTDNLHVEPALLVGRGYAVLLPSLPAPPGPDPIAGLAGQLLKIVGAAQNTPAGKGAFDPSRLAIWGESYGGYTALAALTQTDRFRAAIAESAPTDLFSIEGTFDTNRRVWPEDGVATPWTAGWTEDLQGGMRGSPWSHPLRYLRNSPALAADRITTPLLIFHGDQDGIPLEQAEEMFSALFRQDRDAQLVTYWGEGHTVRSPGNIRDLYRRAFQWLDDALSANPR